MTRALPESIADPTMSTIEMSEMDWGMLDGRFEYAVLNFGTAAKPVPEEGDWAEWTSGGNRYRYRVTCLGLAGYTPGTFGLRPIYNWEASQLPLPDFLEGTPIEFRLEPLSKDAQVLEINGYRPANHFEINELISLALDCAAEANAFRQSEEIRIHNVEGELTPVIKTGNLPKREA